VVTIKHLILEDFLDRIKNYEAVKDLLLLTSIIDPRFKNMYYLEEKEKLEAEKLLREAFLEYKTKNENALREEFKLETKKVKINEEAMMKVFGGNRTLAQSKDIYREVSNYLTVDEINIVEDPLQWWKENAWNFKVLSIIAKDLLAVPATSAPSERIFSKAGAIVTTKRSSLASKTIDPLLFIAENNKRIKEP